ncbi:MAG: ABC transporter ATP-binding protein [Pelagibacteraceae bacterium]|jgi:branched-chain amino acid transport system ATP-binding protein|nr:ABC transporter ATP-binding protein [Pelagibacteraceae bacterium]MBO6467802.1 ABC transporter ATP-binding protein [Pelagibacteraceae bacterium]MBO6479317.1 ABC transporter ATP-binding protein [Pelagibacteraceae bacterium]MDP6784929.1 ABC transporter ATP-binding protein [Alphaproteobacteria bacterium]HJO13813.1 ABC transporter ATP-binding protein [Alphaproteobacteria bacterium]|tara:strand:+ start:1964 stop:2707 length:744 start_codon:yes stop_codon:yes gene_type:complete
MTQILNVEGASKSFGGVVANEDISIKVNQGEIVGLIGPNGSGKTTLFNSIVGTHIIDGGTILFEENDITNFTIPSIARLGLLRTFQKTKIYGDINCMKNMRISIPHEEENILTMFSKIPPEEDRRAEDLLKFVGLYEKRFLRAGELSFGQQKLLEFAMALMNKPKMLLLDEPTAGINPTLINSLIERLKTANKEFGITLLVIEHNMRVIMNLAERIYCLAHGKLLAEGSPADIRNNSKVIDAYLGAQ